MNLSIGVKEILSTDLKASLFQIIFLPIFMSMTLNHLYLYDKTCAVNLKRFSFEWGYFVG